MLNSSQKPSCASRSLFGIRAFWFSPRIRWNSSSNGALAVSCCIRGGYRQWVRSRKSSPLIEDRPTPRCRNRISPQSRPLSSEHYFPHTIGDGGWALYDCGQHPPPSKTVAGGEERVPAPPPRTDRLPGPFASVRYQRFSPAPGVVVASRS